MIIENLTEKQYNELKGYRSSVITTTTKKTLAHAKAQMDNDIESKSSAFSFGLATHCYLLQPSEFDKKYAVLSLGYDGRTKAGIAERQDIEAQGKDFVKYDEFQGILKIVQNIQNNLNKIVLNFVLIYLQII